MTSKSASWLTLTWPDALATAAVPGALWDLATIAARAWVVDATYAHDTGHGRSTAARRFVEIDIPEERVALWAREPILDLLREIFHSMFAVPYEPVVRRGPALVVHRASSSSETRARGAAADDIHDIILASDDIDTLAGLAQQLIGRCLRVALVRVGPATRMSPPDRPVNALDRLIGRLPAAGVRSLVVGMRLPSEPPAAIDALGRRSPTGYLLVRLVVAVAVARCLGHEHLSIFHNGVANLGLPLMVQSMRPEQARWLHPRAIAALERLLAEVLARPFHLRNPFLAKTPHDVMASLVPNGCADLALDFGRCEQRPELPYACGHCASCIDRSIGFAAAGLGRRRGGPSRVPDAMVADLHATQAARSVSAYIASLRAMCALSDIELLGRLGPAMSRLDPLERHRDESQSLLIDLARRHMGSVQGAIASALRCYSAEIVAGTLPPACLLVEVIRPGDEARLGRRQPTFRKFGDVWELSFHDGEAVYVKDTRGMAYIHLLLQHPHRDYSAAELRAVVLDLPNAAPGDLGPLVDDRALAAYKRRMDQLRAELRAARAETDLARVQRHQRELHLLEAEIRRAVGMGGRARHATDAERARKAVANAIRRALAHLQHVHESLAEHLAAALVIGNHLSYAPGVELAWRL